MHLSKKTMVVIAGAVTAGVIGAGVAFAAFLATSNSSDVSGNAQSWMAPSVTGVVDTPNLLPSESSNVTLTLTNDNDGVQAQVVSVEPDLATLAITSNGTPPECKEYIQLAGLDEDQIAALEKVPAGESIEVSVPNGVTFQDVETDQSACQGMTFTAQWTVQFKAVR